MVPPLIALLEDDPDIVDVVRLHLEDAGFQVRAFGDGRLGYDYVRSGGADLVVLDLTLPSLDGLEICSRLRAGGLTLPILMLTARSDELDRVMGLEIGADDYLVKPFSVRELVARVKALRRRAELRAAAPGDADRPPLRRGPLWIDPAQRRVRVWDREVNLTAREFDLLYYFARHPKRVFSRSHLLDALWGRGYDGFEHTVNTHINRLRRKIERDPAHPTIVVTVWGVGYRLGALEDLDMPVP